MIIFCYQGRMQRKANIHCNHYNRTEHRSINGKFGQSGKQCKILIAQAPYVCSPNTDPSLTTSNTGENCICFHRILLVTNSGEAVFPRQTYNIMNWGSATEQWQTLAPLQRMSPFSASFATSQMCCDCWAAKECTLLKAQEFRNSISFWQATKNDILITTAIKIAPCWKDSTKEHVAHESHGILMA